MQDPVYTSGVPVERISGWGGDELKGGREFEDAPTQDDRLVHP